LNGTSKLMGGLGPDDVCHAVRTTTMIKSVKEMFVFAVGGVAREERMCKL
jgi:hypothetical protein